MHTTFAFDWHFLCDIFREVWSGVMENFTKEQIVPDVISSIPEAQLKVGASKLIIGVSSKVKNNVCLFVFLFIGGAPFRSSSGQKVDIFLTVNVNALWKVQWDGKDLEPGAQWTPTQVKDQPFVHWEVDDGAFYTVVMTGRLLVLFNHNFAKMRILIIYIGNIGIISSSKFDRSRCTQQK